MSAAVPCVYCRQRPAAEPHQPFCSERCRMADLGRWLGGDYRVPGPAADEPRPAHADTRAGDEPDDPDRADLD